MEFLKLLFFLSDRPSLPDRWLSPRVVANLQPLSKCFILTDSGTGPKVTAFSGPSIFS